MNVVFHIKESNMEKISNTRQLQALITLAVESAREEIDKINFRKIESSLSEEDFNDFFRHITSLDEMLKTIQISISEIKDKDPENKPDINIDSVFSNEETLFRLFYMINDYLNKWRFMLRKDGGK